MTLIEKLQYHEDNQLEAWYDFDDKSSKTLAKEVVDFATHHPNELKRYCVNTTPKDFSSLSIVYEALSTYSVAFNDFLYEEIRRVVNLAKNGQIDPKKLGVLEDIEVEDIQLKTEPIYVKIMDFLTRSLQPQNNQSFNVELLKIIDHFLIFVDEEDGIREYDQWINRIKIIATNSTAASAATQARKVLKDADIDVSFAPIPFLARIKSLFS